MVLTDWLTAIYETKVDPSYIGSSLFLRFGSMWPLSVPSYKHVAKTNEFWVMRGGPAACITHSESNIRRCFSEDLLNVAENNIFVCSLQKELLWE